MVRAAFGTNNVDNCARVCHSASVHGLAQTLGSGAMTNPIADITEDVDMILLVGSNPEEAHPVIGAQIRQAIQRGTQVVVVDPRKINLVKDSALHLQVQAGTNVAFANGMMHVILKEGLADRHFIEERTEGFLDLEKWWLIIRRKSRRNLSYSSRRFNSSSTHVCKSRESTNHLLFRCNGTFDRN